MKVDHAARDDAVPRDPARLFIALRPGPRVRDALASWQRSWSWPSGAAPVHAEDLHLTLHFLGNVTSTTAAELQAALQQPFRGFEMRFGRAGLWRGGLAVVELDDVSAALSELRAAMGEALRRLGLRVEARPFRPHVTLARRAAGAVVPSSGLVLPWRVRSFVLMESMPGRSGGYRQCCRFP